MYNRRVANRVSTRPLHAAANEELTGETRHDLGDQPIQILVRRRLVLKLRGTNIVQRLVLLRQLHSKCAQTDSHRYSR